MFCSQCGTEISDNSILCEHCGSPITSNTKRETFINNDRPIPKSERHQSKGKQVLIVLGIILLIVGLLVFIFSFEKSESDKSTPPVKIVVPKSTHETVIPTPTGENVVTTLPVETIVPKSTDETVIPTSTDENVIPTPTDENVVPTPPSSSSEQN